MVHGSGNLWGGQTEEAVVRIMWSLPHAFVYFDMSLVESHERGELIARRELRSQGDRDILQTIEEQEQRGKGPYQLWICRNDATQGMMAQLERLERQEHSFTAYFKKIKDRVSVSW